MMNKNIKDDSIMVLDKNTIELLKKKEIFFPNICLICGDKTEERLTKIIDENLDSLNNQSRRHYFNVPVCKKCQRFISSQNHLKSKEKKNIVIYTLIGAILSIIIGILMFSLIFGISLFLFSLFVPYFKYRSILKTKINFDNYIKINLTNNNDSIRIMFSNDQYLRYIEKLNS